LKCEQCDAFDRVLKKNKETIRSLKFQLIRCEEKYHDLKVSKTHDSNSFLFSLSGGTGNNTGANSATGTASKATLESELHRMEHLDDGIG
jgi:hypothetical protein